VLIGAAVVFFLFPKHERENELLSEYAMQDANPASGQLQPSS
jgi:hypothetical protein